MNNLTMPKGKIKIKKKKQGKEELTQTPSEQNIWV